MPTSSELELPVGDGARMRAYAARPDGPGPFPGLIVFQEAFGVTPHIRSVADRFAAEGYLAVAPELFHRTAPPGWSASYADFPSVAPHVQAVTEATLEADARAAWDWLAAQPETRPGAIGAIGYCLGGRASFVANVALPLKAAVSYYGGRIVPVLVRRAPELHAPMLFFWGGLDKHIPPEQTAAVGEELRKAGKPHISVQVSYADHGFFRDGSPSYQPEAARESWALTLAFLAGKMAR
jgi:carboxymethylenebutenolidase